jgi:hypothetical protein
VLRIVKESLCDEGVDHCIDNVTILQVPGLVEHDPPLLFGLVYDTEKCQLYIKEFTSLSLSLIIPYDAFSALNSII